MQSQRQQHERRRASRMGGKKRQEGIEMNLARTPAKEVVKLEANQMAASPVCGGGKAVDQ